MYSQNQDDFLAYFVSLLVGERRDRILQNILLLGLRAVASAKICTNHVPFHGWSSSGQLIHVEAPILHVEHSAWTRKVIRVTIILMDTGSFHYPVSHSSVNLSSLQTEYRHPLVYYMGLQTPLCIFILRYPPYLLTSFARTSYGGWMAFCFTQRQLRINFVQSTYPFHFAPRETLSWTRESMSCSPPPWVDVGDSYCPTAYCPTVYCPTAYRPTAYLSTISE